jgi:hypothetical protein
MVSYRAADGQQSYHETDELNDAIAFVEHLRNDQAVDHARIFTMEEVSFEFRPYFRVEIAANGTSTTTSAVASEPAPDTRNETNWLAAAQGDASVDEMDRDPLAAAWVAAEHADERDDSVPAGMGRRGLFGR